MQLFPHISNSCSLESYVDDSKLYLSFSVKDTEDAAARLTGDLQRIAAWGSSHSLLILPDKTKLLLLGTRQMLNRVPDTFHITLLGKEISLVPSARDLVVEIFLSYDKHITSVVSKCIASLYQINRVKHILDKQSQITVINACFQVDFTTVHLCGRIRQRRILLNCGTCRIMLHE